MFSFSTLEIYGTISCAANVLVVGCVCARRIVLSHISVVFGENDKRYTQMCQ